MNNNTKLVDKRKPPFIWIYIESLSRFKGNPSAAFVYLHIVRRAGHDGTCWQSIDGMASDCGISSGTLKRALAFLLSQGMITRSSRKGRSSLYKVTSIEEWKEPGSNPTQVKNDPGKRKPRSNPTHLPGSNPAQVGGSNLTHELDPIEKDPSELDPSVYSGQSENLEKQPTHTGNSDLNFEDDRSGTLEQPSSETLDSGTLEQESLEIQTPVKKSKTEIEYLDLNNNPGLGISSAGARENLTSPAENAPKTRGNDLKVSNPIQPHSVPLSEFIQVYNKHRGNWRSIGVAPAPVVVAGIFGYRQSFTGTDEEFLAKFPLLLKAAQSSGGNWFKSKRNPSEIFHPDRLPLNDFWEDVQPAPLPAPEPQPQPSPAPGFSLKSFID